MLKIVSVLSCLLLAGCATEPAKRYFGPELPPEKTAFIELDDDYEILALNGRQYIRVAPEQWWGTPWYAQVGGERDAAIVKPRKHRLTVIRRSERACRNSIYDLLGRLLFFPILICAEVKETHCATFVFTAEAGHKYEVSMGDDDTVLLSDNDNLWSANRSYLGEATKKDFLDLCLKQTRAMAKADIPAGSSGTVAKATPKITQEPGEKWVFEIMEGQSPSSADKQIVSIVDNKFSVNVATNGWRGNISGEIDHLGNLAGTGTIRRMGSTPRTFEFSASQSDGAFHTSVVIDAQIGSVTTITIELARQQL
jgi:hypothetical protein